MSAEKQVARPGSLEPLAETSMTYRYMAPLGHTLEMVSHPEYWKNNARECKHTRISSRNAWNKIEVIAMDGSWEAELRIMAVSEAGHVETRCIREWQEAGKPGRKPQLPEGYKVEIIPEQGWRALDRFGAIIAQKLPIESKALEAALDHARKAKVNS